MPTLDQVPPSEDYLRLLGVGDSGTGKTGSLLSLLQAGYHVGVVDMDNGLAWLKNKIRAHHPELAPRLSWMTFRDKMKLTKSGPIYSGMPSAYTSAIQALTTWEDGSNPSEWGPDRVLVLDSLTFFGNAAYNWKDALNPTVKDKRQIYGEGQNAVEEILSVLTSDDYHTHVVIFSHIRWVARQDGTTKGYPSALGEALSPKISTYFNSVALYESMGQGAAQRRMIRTTSTPLMDLKNETIDMLPQLPIETGLADFFKAARRTSPSAA